MVRKIVAKGIHNLNQNELEVVKTGMQVGVQEGDVGDTENIKKRTLMHVFNGHPIAFLDIKKAYDSVEPIMLALMFRTIGQVIDIEGAKNKKARPPPGRKKILTKQHLNLPHKLI